MIYNSPFEKGGKGDLKTYLVIMLSYNKNLKKYSKKIKREYD